MPATYLCPDDLALPLQQLLSDATFEVRALRNVLRSMNSPEDAELAAKVVATCELLQDHILRIPILLAPCRRIAFCCLLEWYWHQQRPILSEALRQGRIARCYTSADDYERQWHSMTAPVERELAVYPSLAGRREREQHATAILHRRIPSEHEPQPVAGR